MAFLPILLLMLLWSCATPPSSPIIKAEEKMIDAGSKEGLFWPLPPEKPRIKFLYAFRDTKDLKFPISIFQRAKRIIYGEKDLRMIRPYSVAVDVDLIVVADPGARALHYFDMNKNMYRRFTKAGDALLHTPIGVAMGANKIYISDSARGKVYGIDYKGRRLFAIKDVERPTGLAFEKKNSWLYVADTLGFRIRVYDQSGKRLFAFGKRGIGTGEFN